MPDDHDPLPGLVEEFIERCRRGESPSVEDYAARHPDLAGDIRELFPTILTVERVKHSSVRSDASLDAGWEPPLGRLGDFRIVRELGRGGMGIVYEAEQESLGRRVAIKVLPRQHLADPRRRDRFDRESRTAARLHHTNIVPIFGVGEQDGYHYFVMQYIRGVGLDVVFRTLGHAPAGPTSGGPSTSAGPVSTGALVQIAREVLQGDFRGDLAAASEASTLTGSLPSRSRAADLPSSAAADAGARFSAGARPPRAEERRHRVLNTRYWRDLALLLAQAADALAYAHSQGVLHRDIKPSNLLLDPDGTLWVADFGLAKALDHDGITQAGDVVGTLRYMAPEQFKGHMEIRSDVYSLGVTLYELATLRPAFTESKASSMIHAIMEKPLLPPRQFCPSMPRDLETIILRATAREPVHRYGSAGELRDDLHRFAEDRPIHARRVSAAERLRRWAWRNPALALTTVLSFVLLGTVAAVATAAYFNVRFAKSRETQQRQRAEATASVAVEALDSIFNEFAPETLLTAHEFSLGSSQEYTVAVAMPIVLSRETAVFLEHMLDCYEKLGQQEGSSLPVQLKVAAAQRRVGEIHERLGHYSEAEAAYQDAIRQYEKIRAASPGNPGVQTALARVHNQMATVLFAGDDFQQAESHLETAQEILRPLYQAGLAAPESQYELARTLYLMAARGGLGWLRAGPPPGERPDRRGRGRDGERNREGSGPLRPPFGAKGEGFGPGRVERSDQPPDGVRNRGPRGQRGGPDRGAVRPPESQPEAWEAFRARFATWRQQRQDHLQEAVEILARLSEQRPRMPEYRHLLARCLRELHGQGPPFGRREPQNDQLNRAVQILEDLASEYRQYRFDLAETYAMQDRGPRAREQVEKAIAISRELVAEQPHVPSYSLLLGDAFVKMAWIDWLESRWNDSLESLREGVRLHENLMEQFPGNVKYLLPAIRPISLLAGALQSRSESGKARPLLEDIVGRLEALPAAELTPPHIRGAMCGLYYQLADIYQELGEQALEAEARKRADALRPFPFAPMPPTRPSPPS